MSELLLFPLTAMGAVFILSPWAAAFPAGFFYWIYRRSRRRVALAAAILWLMYLPYEAAMKWRLLCSGECNIRVDLLLIYPVLLTVSAIALIAGLVQLRRRQRG